MTFWVVSLKMKFNYNFIVIYLNLPLVIYITNSYWRNIFTFYLIQGQFKKQQLPCMRRQDDAGGL